MQTQQYNTTKIKGRHNQGEPTQIITRNGPRPVEVLREERADRRKANGLPVRKLK